MYDRNLLVSWFNGFIPFVVLFHAEISVSQAIIRFQITNDNNFLSTNFASKYFSNNKSYLVIITC